MYCTFVSPNFELKKVLAWSPLWSYIKRMLYNLTDEEVKKFMMRSFLVL